MLYLYYGGMHGRNKEFERTPLSRTITIKLVLDVSQRLQTL